MLTRLKALPVDGLHIDLCRAPDQLETFLDNYPAEKVLSLGIVDGRNIWRSDLARSLSTAVTRASGPGREVVDRAELFSSALPG